MRSFLDTVYKIVLAFSYFLEISENAIQKNKEVTLNFSLTYSIDIHFYVVFHAGIEYSIKYRHLGQRKITFRISGKSDLNRINSDINVKAIPRHSWPTDKARDPLSG